MARAARAGQREAAASAVEATTIVALSEAGRVEVRVREGGGRTRAASARLSQIAGYAPSEGDRVVVARDGEELYVVAVLQAARPPALALPGGGTAELRGEALELRDAEGRLLVRYAGGVAEVSSPARDLVLAAPNGRVVLRSGTDVSVEAARDVVQHAGRRVDLCAGEEGAAPQVRVEPGATRVDAAKVDVRARAAQVAVGEASVFARSIATTAEQVAQRVVRYEVEATRLVSKTREALHEVSEVLEQRLGRARTLVRGTFTLRAGRSVLVSREATSIDGKKVLLG